MGKVGYKKPEHSSKKGEVKHNYVDGPAYEVKDAANKLIHVVGTFFNEPTYYGENSPNNNGLTEQAQVVVDTANALAESSPEDLLVIAAWARDIKNGLKLRTTPQVLLAVACNHKESKPFVKNYAEKIMVRADDIRTAFAAYVHLFANKEKKTLPNVLKQSLAKVLAKQSPYSLIKYNSGSHPTFRDVLSMIKGKKMANFSTQENGYPLSKPLYEYLAFGKVTDESPEIVRKRTEIFKSKDISKFTEEDFKVAGLTWENLLSHFGSKPEIWRIGIPVMGEMALTRNLRNFEQANLLDSDWDLIEKNLLAVEKTVQLPFRFLSAYKNITTGRAKAVISQMFDKSVQSVPELPGKTVTFVDNSGSMDSKVSKDSSISLKEAGNCLGAILSKRNSKNIDVHVFSDYVVKVEIDYSNTGVSILEKIGNTRCGYGGTNVDDVAKYIDNYTNNNIIVDRFVILSDMCCYHFGWGGQRRSLQKSFDEYKRRVNPNAYLYSCNLAGYSQAQVNPEAGNVIIMSGWSENIFKIMLESEGRVKADNKILPTIEELRKMYKD